jgi:hypothetical protein
MYLHRQTPVIHIREMPEILFSSRSLADMKCEGQQSFLGMDRVMFYVNTDENQERRKIKINLFCGAAFVPRSKLLMKKCRMKIKKKILCGKYGDGHTTKIR